MWLEIKSRRRGLIAKADADRICRAAITTDPEAAALEEAGRFFMGTSPVHQTLHEIGRRLGLTEPINLLTNNLYGLVEPFALDGRAANLAGNPAAAFFYTASTFLCTPSSLSQEVGRGMGAQSGESGMRAVFEEAGFTTFERVHESPFNIVYQAQM